MKRSLALRALLLMAMAGAGARAHAQGNMSPGPLHEQLVADGLGSRLQVRLADHEKIHGKLTAILSEEFEVKPKGAAVPVVVPFAAVATLKVEEPREPLGARFKMGPCVGPITLAIATPFILASWATGH